MSDTALERRRTRALAWIAGGLAGVVLLLGAFPWGVVARHAGGPLSRALGRPVTVGSARRLDWFSYAPLIELDDVRVAQPNWAGPGDMARADRLRLRLPVLPLLVGRLRPSAIEVGGLDLRLVRDAHGRDNWSGGAPQGGGGAPQGGGGAPLREIGVRDGRLRLEDAKRQVVLNATLVSDREHGLRLAGTGRHRDQPLQLDVTGPALAGADPDAAYPLRIAVRSPLATLAGQARLDRPLDFGHFAATVTASGRDLRYLDDLIQAGLFPTQPFHLTADIRHDGTDWRIRRLDARVGRSTLRATMAIGKAQGRTRLDGGVEAGALDFDDFASDAQRARAAAERRRIGPRVIPATRIQLDKLGRLDGRLTVRARRLLSTSDSPFRSLGGTITLDDRRMTLAPFTVGLRQGTMAGAIVVDGRQGGARLSLDLTVRGATIQSLFPLKDAVDGPLRAHLRLAGAGPTLRAALARASGKAGFAVTGGSLRHDYATFLGGDVLKSVGAAIGGQEARTPLDCLVGRFEATGGRLVPRPLVLDTPVARGDGAGAITLGDEAIDLRINGRPHKAGLLQSTAPVRLFGTLSQPKIDIRPPVAQSQRKSGLFSRLGFFLKKLRVRGDASAAPAPPAACPALTAAALR